MIEFERMRISLKLFKKNQIFMASDFTNALVNIARSAFEKRSVKQLARTIDFAFFVAPNSWVGRKSMNSFVEKISDGKDSSDVKLILSTYFRNKAARAASEDVQARLSGDWVRLIERYTPAQNEFWFKKNLLGAVETRYEEYISHGRQPIFDIRKLIDNEALPQGVVETCLLHIVLYDTSDELYGDNEHLKNYALGSRCKSEMLKVMYLLKYVSSSEAYNVCIDNLEMQLKNCSTLKISDRKALGRIAFTASLMSYADRSLYFRCDDNTNGKETVLELAEAFLRTLQEEARDLDDHARIVITLAGTCADLLRTHNLFEKANEVVERTFAHYLDKLELAVRAIGLGFRIPSRGMSDENSLLLRQCKEKLTWQFINYNHKGSSKQKKILRVVRLLNDIDKRQAAKYLLRFEDWNNTAFLRTALEVEVKEIAKLVENEARKSGVSSEPY